jgi:hypothetical protein
MRRPTERSSNVSDTSIAYPGELTPASTQLGRRCPAIPHDATRPEWASSPERAQQSRAAAAIPCRASGPARRKRSQAGPTIPQGATRPDWASSPERAQQSRAPQAVLDRHGNPMPRTRPCAGSEYPTRCRCRASIYLMKAVKLRTQSIGLVARHARHPHLGRARRIRQPLLRG